jgi:hypothetical protein
MVSAAPCCGESSCAPAASTASGTPLANVHGMVPQGDDVDRRRIKLQLRLVIAILRAEHARSGRAAASIAERSTSIIEKAAIEIRPEEDAELVELLGDARAAVGLLVNEP